MIKLFSDSVGDISLAQTLRLYRLPLVLCFFGVLLSIAGFAISIQSAAHEERKTFLNTAATFSRYMEQRLEQTFSHLSLFEEFYNRHPGTPVYNPEAIEALLNNPHLVGFALVPPAEYPVAEKIWINRTVRHTDSVYTHLSEAITRVAKWEDDFVETLRVNNESLTIYVKRISDKHFLAMIVDLKSLLTRSYLTENVLNMLEFDLFANYLDQDKSLFHFSPQKNPESLNTVQARTPVPSSLKFEKNFTLQGNPWKLSIIPSVYYFGYFNQPISWIILALGLMLTGVVSFAVFQLLTKNVEVNAEVERRTHQLKQESFSRQQIEQKLDVAKQEELYAAKRTKAILETVVDGIITINTRGIIESFNPSAEKIFGYKAQEVIGRKVNMLMPSPYQEEHDDYIGRFMETGQARIIGIGREVKARRKDGSVFPMELGVSDFTLGDKTMFVGSIRDISDRKHAEEKVAQHSRLMETINFELAIAKKEAEQANRLKSEFLANMSHEIRTPLNTVIGVASILQQTELTEKQHGSVERIMNGGRILLGIISNILDISKIESGAMEIEHSPFNHKKLVHDLVDMNKAEAGRKNIELLLTEDETAPEEVMGDATRLSQILNNLIGNAIKFTSAGSVHLTYRMVSANANGIQIEYQVADTGIGIPKKQQENIFQKFVQADISMTKKYGGSGLGLAICKQLAEIMGGEIRFESQERKGTTFFVTLPFSPSVS